MSTTVSIIVRVGKKVPIEGMNFSSRDYGIEIQADLAPGEDVSKAYAELKAMGERLVDEACGLSTKAPEKTEAERIREAVKDPVVQGIVEKFEGDVVKAEPQEAIARREAPDLAKAASAKVGAERVRAIVKEHGAAKIADVPTRNIIALWNALKGLCDG